MNSKDRPLQPLDGYFLLAINANAGLAGRADLVLNLSGSTGGAYRLQSSGNLVEWETVTNVTFSTALLQVTNAPTPDTQEFYRLIAP